MPLRARLTAAGSAPPGRRWRAVWGVGSWSARGRRRSKSVMGASIRWHATLHPRRWDRRPGRAQREAGMNEPLAELFRYNAWATARLLDACEGLTQTQLK